MLKPKQPFVDWLNAWGGKGHALSLKEVGKDPDAILIPEFESNDEAMAFVHANAEKLFEHVLEDWCTDRCLWPTYRDFEKLCHWFEIIMHSLVFDAVDGEDDSWERN